MLRALVAKLLGRAERAACRPDPLTQAVEALEAAAARGELDAGAMRRCVAIESRHPRAHRRWITAGQLALEAGEHALAEDFAARALIASPRFGAAFKLLGSAASAAGRAEDAAVGFRYGLAESVRARLFGHVSVSKIRSTTGTASGVTSLAAFARERHRLRAPWQLVARQIDELDMEILNAAPARTIRVTDGRLFFDGFNRVVWNRDGQVIEDLIQGNAEVVAAHLDGRDARRLEGRVCLLGNRNSLNYYHWMNDVLPCIEVLQSSGIAIDSIDRFVGMPAKQSFHRESLERFAIDGSRWHLPSDGEYVQADELVVPVYGSNTLGQAQGAWNPAFLKRSFAPATLSPPARRLYVSRGSTGARGIENEPEVQDVLERYGFATVRCESLSIREQARLFSQAAVVVGPHGAGLSNIAFCQPGALVLELFSAHIAPCFWLISELCGLRHAVHFCGEFDDATRPQEHERYHRSADDRRRAPFQVPIDELRTVLERLGVDESKAA